MCKARNNMTRQKGSKKGFFHWTAGLMDNVEVPGRKLGLGKGVHTEELSENIEQSKRC